MSGASIPLADRLRAVVLAPDRSDAHETMGRALIVNRNYGAAAASFRRAADISPERADLQVELGRALRLGGNSVTAIPPLARAVELAPDRSEAHYELGRAYLIVGRPEPSERSLWRAMVLDPASVPIHQTMARCLWRLQRLPQVEAAADRWLDLAPGAAEALAMKAGAILKRLQVARLDEASSLLARALEIEPKNAGAREIARDLGRIRLFLDLDRAYRGGAQQPARPATPGPDEAGGIAGKLAQRICEAALNREPFSHFFLDRVFADDVYRRIIDLRPSMRFAMAGAVDANYQDRKGFDLAKIAEIDAARAQFWLELYAAMKSPVVLDAFIDALQARDLAETLHARGFRLKVDVRLLCDCRGYALTPHKDHFSRFGSIVFNLPDSMDHPQAGTSLYVRTDGVRQFDNGLHHKPSRFRRVATAPYVPNSACGFINFGEAYHGVEPLSYPIDRWNMQYTVRVE